METEVVEFVYRNKELKLVLPKGDVVTGLIKKWKSFYEHAWLTLLIDNNFINNSMKVVDIGACTGNHTVFFAAFCDHVIAFEPCKKSYNCLVESVALNEMTNVDSYNKAVGNIEGEIETRWTTYQPNIGAKFWWYVNDEGTLRWYDPTRLKPDPDHEVCEVVKLDTFLDGADIDFIKIDVEGMEFEVLYGAENIIKTQSPLIMVELWKDKYRIFDWMKDNGYKKLEPGWGGTTWLIGKS